MTRQEFVQQCDGIEKLIRTEYSFSQQKMSETLGISKKTLVEIEKGRSSLGWTGSVALCSIFARSRILADTFGGEPSDIIQALALEQEHLFYPKTMDGRIWWKDMETCGDYKVQQNYISRHYRILNKENQRIYSAFDYEEIRLHLMQLQGKGRL
ncbi:MAG: hypothetical protein ACI4LA_08985 [Emergencia sp.]